MNNLFKDKLALLTNDELLVKAIRAVFDERIKKEKPNVEKTNDNRLLGEKYRAYEKAKQMLDKGFIDIMSYQVDKNKPKDFHKER